MKQKIITVGVNPTWDIKCVVKNAKWGGHIVADDKTKTPAGKAMNVSKTLAWMRTSSIAAGLWGSQDHKQMREHIKKLSDLIKIKMTVVKGKTRENFWIVDIAEKKELHLRFKSELANNKTLKQLGSDIFKMTSRNDIVVFAGSMPNDALGVINKAKQKGGRIVIDSSGQAMKKIVKSGGLFLIKPNVDELRELVGKNFRDTESSIIKNARGLLGKTEMVLVSRGVKGAMLITSDGIYSGNVSSGRKAVAGTVACGDFMLGGFLCGIYKGKNLADALGMGIIAGSGRAFGMDEKSFANAKRNIKVSVKRIY